MGALAFGILPLGFELAREATFPVEPSTGLSVLFVTGQIVSALLILVSGAMEQELGDKFLAIEVTWALAINILCLSVIQS